MTANDPTGSREPAEIDTSDRADAMTPHDQSATVPASVVTPRLLAFYRDAWDDDGTAVGWQTIAWGLVLADGSAISIPIEGPVRVTLWHSVTDALVVLDAYVDDLGPRRTIDADDVRPLPRPSTAPSPVGAGGAVTQGACPDHLPAGGRDGPQAGDPVVSATTSGGQR